MHMSDWYYAHDGQQKGPVPISELERLASQGEFEPEKDLVWREGMDDWKPAAEVADFGLTKNAGPDASGSAADNSDPYATPGSSYDEASPLAGAELPAVKPAKFALFAVPYILGTLGVLAGYGMMLPEYLRVFQEAVEAGPEAPAPQWPVMPPLVSGITIISFILMLIGMVFGLIYLHRAWVLLQPHTKVSTPGKAVGFLFIPLFNLYWVFIAYWRWSQEWNRLVAASPSHPKSPRVTEGLFLTYAILSTAGTLFGALALLPMLIIQLMVVKSLCNVVNYGAHSRAPEPA